MAISLLFVKRHIYLHIALLIVLLFSSQQGKTQSILLPGDVVVISANASNDSFEFIPLMDIEKNTTIYFSNSLPDENGNHRDEIRILFKQDISAGTNFNIGLYEDARIEADGILKFTEKNHLFAYQREKEIERYLFGIAWGKTPEQKEKERSIPPSLADHAFVQLGEAANYQYFIRNGASGTASMLLKFVRNAENWRSAAKPFSALGTSFTLLHPPVVMFTNSYSGADETDSTKKLEIAIFEHDGSRLTVDVVYDSLRSITNKADFDGFTSETVNFTGLVGDGVYNIDIPIYNDSEFEGDETGIFTLKNLSKGSLGDFTTHSLIIFDDEHPNVDVSLVLNSTAQNSFIQLTNKEKGVISLKGWKLKTSRNELVLSEDISMMPGESIKLMDKASSEIDREKVHPVELNKLLEKNGGELLLSAMGDKIISRMVYGAKSAAIERKSEVNQQALAKNKINVDNTGNHGQIMFKNTPVNKSGLKVLPPNADIFTLYPEMKFQSWNENLQTFEEVDKSMSRQPAAIFGYFENLDEVLRNLENQAHHKASANPKLQLNISATDVNENEAVDGLEGLNLIYNDLNVSFSVASLLQKLEELNPEVNFSSNIYTMEFLENGKIYFDPKSGTDVIEAGAPFWLMLNDFHENLNLTVNQSALEFETVVSDSAKKDRDLVFSVQDGIMTDRISVQFSKDRIQEPVKDISAYPAFNFSGRQKLNIAIQQGIERYSNISVLNDPAQNITLPLFLSASSNVIKFKLNDGIELASGYEIFVEDKKRDRLLKVEEGRELLLEIENPDSDHAPMNTENTTSPRYYLIFRSLTKSDAAVEENTLPQELELYQNYPNPFNPFTTISFYLPEPGEVKLSVFNIVGQPVAVLVDRTLSAGQQQFEWDATDRPSGMYIYQLEAGNKVLTRKMTLVK